jgi:PadR family transcriptional regulator PadR
MLTADAGEHPKAPDKKLPLDNLQEDSYHPSSRLSRRRAMAKPTDLIQGTLDMLILKTLALGAMHGWGISQRIQQVSQDVLVINQGSLYPALYRLEQQGLIKSEWGSSDNNRQAKFYELTRTGKKQLTEETENWERLSAAVDRILQVT